MPRLTDILWAAKKVPLIPKVGPKKVPSYMKVNRHFRYTMYKPGSIQSQLENLPGRNRPPVLLEPIKNWKYYKGDLVEILEGKDKGKQGTISDIIRERNWVIVEGLNCNYRRIGKTPTYRGTYIASEAPLLHNQVKLVDPSDNLATDIDFRFTEEGEKVRVSQRTGRIIPIPDEALDKTKEMYQEQPKDTKETEVCEKTFKPSLKSVEEQLMDAYNIVDTGVKPKTYWY
ncbi:large ribosomal subunit protein uL24m-like [Amphiura filiformis]|uniref:large ribosomal subunit protein uL24m-like n=1 Tax=Amphiura filiformis TaxID=82378 RepID=UPI003B21F654